MQRFVIIGSLSGSLFIFGLTSGALEHATMFVLFGMVPGRDEPISAGTMLLLWGVLLSLYASTGILRVSKLSAFRFTNRRNRTA